MGYSKKMSLQYSDYFFHIITARPFLYDTHDTKIIAYIYNGEQPFCLL